MADDNKEESCITSEEISKLGEALKDDKFRKMFLEYAEEMSDPDNRERYEEELKILEREKGMDITFIYPEGNYVIKTARQDEQKKIFINVCNNKHVEKPSCSRVESDTPGLNWNIPYFLSKPQEDLDKAGKPCTVYDVVFHADTLYMSQKNSRFRHMVEQTALDGIEEKFGVQLKRECIQYPKMKYKGNPIPSVIRKKVENSSPVMEELGIEDEYQPPAIGNTVPDVLRPNYTIKHRSTLNMEDYTILSTTSPNTRPKELVISIELPLVESINNVDLDVKEKTLSLSSSEKKSYSLSIDLPFAVYNNKGNATFDWTKKMLTVTLPVIPFSLRKNSVNEEFETDVESKCDKLSEPPKTVENEALHDRNTSNENVNKNELEMYHVEKQKNLNLNDYVRKYNNEEHEATMVENFVCNETEKAMAIILYLRDIDPESIETEITPCKTAFFITATNLDGRFLLALKTNGDVKIENHTLDVSEKNIVLKLTKNKAASYSGCIEFMGRRGWEKYNFKSEKHLINTNLKFKEEHEAILQGSTPLDNHQVSVLDISEDTVSVGLQMSAAKAVKPERPNKLDGIEENVRNYFPTMKQRTSSESSEFSEDMSPMRRYRGILKNSASWRSISESSDDFGWSSHDLMSPESDCGDTERLKKSVRFSDNISRTVFRANSSILGQKKKNQKRNLNKKKNASKKGKYSGTSGSESEGMSGTSDYEGNENDNKSEENEENIALQEKENNDLQDNEYQKLDDDSEFQKALENQDNSPRICDNAVETDVKQKFEKLDFRTSKNRVNALDSNPDFRTNLNVNSTKNKRGKPSYRNKKNKSSKNSSNVNSSSENDAQSESLSEENDDSETAISGNMFVLD